jgi:hypothetical protein
MNAESAPRLPVEKKESDQIHEMLRRLEVLARRRVESQGTKGNPTPVEDLKTLLEDYKTTRDDLTLLLRSLADHEPDASQQSNFEILQSEQKTLRQAIKKLNERISEREPANAEDDEMLPDAKNFLADMIAESSQTAKELDQDNLNIVGIDGSDRFSLDTLGRLNNILKRTANRRRTGDQKSIKEISNLDDLQDELRLTEARLQKTVEASAAFVARRDELESISPARRSAEQKAELKKLINGLEIAAEVESSLNAELNNIQSFLKLRKKEAEEREAAAKKEAADREAADEKAATEEASLNEQRLLAKRLAAEAKRKVAVRDRSAQLEASAQAKLAAAEQAVGGIEELNAQINDKEETIASLEEALSIVEGKCRIAYSERSKLERSGERTNSAKIKKIQAEIDRLEENIAYKEEAISTLDKELITLRVEVKNRLISADSARDELRFTPDSQAEKRADAAKLAQEKARLADRRERLTAAQAEAVNLRPHLRANAAAELASEMRAAEINRRISGKSERVKAVQAEVDARASSYEKRVSEQLASLSSQEQLIDKQIADLENQLGSSEPISSELSSIQGYLNLDNDGLRTIYTFMKIVEEDYNVLGILPVDIASQVAGRTWTELARELQTASQKTGFMSRMWRSAFGDPNAKLKEALQAISELNPVELRRAANIPVAKETTEQRRRRQGSRFLGRDSSLGNTSAAPFGGVSRW